MKGHQHAAAARPDADPDEVRGWFAGRLPDDWFEGPPEITLDTEEILLVGRLAADGLPDLTTAGPDAAWDYYRANPVEIEQAIWLNDTAGNVPDGVRPPVWVIVSGRLLGLPDGEIREAFEPPLTQADLDAAWAEYRTDPRRVGRDEAAHRLTG